MASIRMFDRRHACCTCNQLSSSTGLAAFFLCVGDLLVTWQETQRFRPPVLSLHSPVSCIVLVRHMLTLGEGEDDWSTLFAAAWTVCFFALEVFAL